LQCLLDSVASGIPLGQTAQQTLQVYAEAVRDSQGFKVNPLKTSSRVSYKLSSRRLSLLLFLLLWFAYGAAINSSNLLDFDLQHVGVEALVERGHFYLEHSIPSQRQSKGDVFTYEGHNYAAKQPGQFMVGRLFTFFCTSSV